MNTADWIGIGAAVIAIGHIGVDIYRWRIEQAQRREEEDRRRPKVHVESFLAVTVDVRSPHLVVRVINNGHVDIVDPSATLEMVRLHALPPDLLQGPPASPRAELASSSFQLNPYGGYRDVLRPHQSQDFFLHPDLNAEVSATHARGDRVSVRVYSGARQLACLDNDRFQRQVADLPRAPAVVEPS